MYQLPSCDEQFGFYQENMERLMDQCFPFKTVTRHSSDKLWMTDSFRQLIKKRQRARMSGNTTLAKQQGDQRGQKVALSILPIKDSRS